MIKNNNKGFTLVELLAMLLILGIFMGIAIPNIAGILTNNKINIMKADATKMVDTAKIKFSRLRNRDKPIGGECIAYSLNYLDDSGDINKGPNGGTYLPYDSMVIVKREGSEYKYFITLIETVDNKYMGMNLVEREILNKDKVGNKDKTDEGEEVKIINEIESSKLLNLTSTTPDDEYEEILNANNEIKSICPGSVINYYPGDDKSGM